MGQLETLAETHYANAAIEACEAIGKLTYAAESGEDLHSEDLARVAVTQFVCGWWQQVMDVVNSEDADGAEAITRIRQEAERRLLMGSPALYGDLFAQAMLQAGRQAAQQFLATTQPLVDVLAGPATTNGRVNSARTEPGTCSSHA
ncbi:hypothetical protein [Nonomuraea sp. NPDC049480]|uniref:hypothetical protein n=1 Tax=Nonomuraea sp. NPDC049480 TaxID=3364353 RepID=UPI002E48A3F4|nr:hypothetical protein [Nonomuraea sp.]